MSLGLHQRYFCTNVAHCPHAREDLPYSEEAFVSGGGVCVGRAGDGCGAVLRQGSPLDRRPKWLAMAAGASAVSIAVGFLVRQSFFPDPIADVRFAAPQSRTQDAAALLVIDVKRVAGFDKRVTVRFSSLDGTAHAGADYEAAQGALTFEPGERSKPLSITILPDSSLTKGERHFSVALSNVAGAPRHVVFIEERQVDRSVQMQAEQTVRAASVVAKDIADYVVRLRVITDLLAASRSDAASFNQYQQASQLTQGNLNRARESYAQFFRDMQAMPPRAILQAMDGVGSNLEHQGFKQQSLATAIMKRQFGEFISQKSLNMDRWAVELSAVVPRLPSSKADAST